MTLGRAPVDPVEQGRELIGGERQRSPPLDVRRPEENAMLQPLGEQAQARAVPEHNLDEIGLTSPEDKEMPGERRRKPRRITNFFF